MSSLSRDLSDLGPLFEVKETTVTQAITQTTIALCSSDPRRWALILSPPDNNTQSYWISTQAANLLNSAGIPLAILSGAGLVAWPMHAMDFRRFGPLVQQAWFGAISGASAPGNPLVWTVTEVLLVN